MIADLVNMKRFIFSRATFRGTESGLYVFTGASPCTVTLASLQPQPRSRDNQILIFKNAGSADLTVSNPRLYTSSIVTSITITADNWAIVIADGPDTANNRWIVLT